MDLLLSDPVPSVSNQAELAFPANGTTSKKTRRGTVLIGERPVPRVIGEFWTSRQRQAAAIHEISYRACFKPQLVRFFVERLTRPGDLVYDPFAGRGTTVIESALLGRQVQGCDINPLSRILTLPRLRLPDLPALRERLDAIAIDEQARAEIDLSMFYHPATEAELVSLRRYLAKRAAEGAEDDLDRWIRMVATSRLTGHSPGFFSVYTLPPNQAVSADRQRKINLQRRQQPEYRNVRRLILRKTMSLLSGLTAAQRSSLAAAHPVLRVGDCRRTPEFPAGSVQLTVTSPPFLDVVQYAGDNWLRCWFNGIDAQAVAARLTLCSSLADWCAVMEEVFHELFRITRPGGWVAFEVGEVRGGRIHLDEEVVPLGIAAGFRCAGILVNEQQFTKTANIWGVHNNRKGTNSNRIVLFNKT